MKFLERLYHYRTRDIQIFHDKFINGLKQVELAKRYGLSSERIRQIIYKETLRYNHYIEFSKIRTTTVKVAPSGRRHMSILRYQLHLLECNILSLEKTQDERIQKSLDRRGLKSKR